MRFADWRPVIGAASMWGIEDPGVRVVPHALASPCALAPTFFQLHASIVKSPPYGILDSHFRKGNNLMSMSIATFLPELEFKQWLSSQYCRIRQVIRKEKAPVS